MTTTEDITRATLAELCRPWLRHLLSQTEWAGLAQAAAAEGWALLAHWADTGHAHALFFNRTTLTVIAASTQVLSGQYPALSTALPAAAWYERMVQDLWGHRAEGGIDLRPWIDHGNWQLSPPMAIRPEPRRNLPPTLIEPERDDIMLLSRGPVWGRITEAAHLQLMLQGPRILHAEALLGFCHKGSMTLMRGKSPRAAARFAARLSADATVAHSVAFAQATEAAADVVVPPRAIGLRIAMMEIERVAGHLDNLAEVARLAGASRICAQCGSLRELLLRATNIAFGHRLMMDCVVPGGLAADIAEAGPETIRRVLGEIASELPAISRGHDAPAMASPLTNLARVDASLVASMAVGGIVGRASGYAFDLRSLFAPGYPDLMPRLAIRQDGDAAARQHLRLREIEESIRLIGGALNLLPAGPGSVALPQVSGEGIGCAESVRGDVWHWLRLDHGQIAAAFPRDPGWALWPLAEHVLQGASAEDIDLIRASLALPASGMDL
jgi:Ni,Fe-hydrogenase III large subunit